MLQARLVQTLLLPGPLLTQRVARAPALGPSSGAASANIPESVAAGDPFGSATAEIG